VALAETEERITPEQHEDPEIREYRQLMTPPTEFEDGFNWKTVIGAFFIGFVMMPGSIYLGLVAGQTMGPAAEWVTIILFVEVARRAFISLRRQEIYLLYYIAGALTSTVGIALSGGPFAHLIWWQFFRQSPAAAGIEQLMPGWNSPPLTSTAYAQRTFFHPDWWRDALTGGWLGPIPVIIISYALSRLSWFGLGYTLFRITSDVERLSFPLAPVAAMGATALAESSSKTETWRWRVFSIGAMIGLTFGVVYIGLPTFSGMILIRPIALLPIPWIDFTHATEGYLPAAPTGISTSVAPMLIGFVLPFWAVIGSTVAAAVTVFLNPVLYHVGVLHTWQPGMDTIFTNFANQIDFWISFSIGTAFAVAAIGIAQIIKSLRQDARARQKQERRGVRSLQPPPGRGDIPLIAAVGAWLFATVCSVALVHVLVPNFPVTFLLFFGFLWTPMTSYVDARLRGLAGQHADFPYVSQATFIYSTKLGYSGVGIWFAPIPMGNYGWVAQSLRELELTGTKVSSLIKAELLLFPIVLVCSFLFWSYIWGLGAIPSINYPFAQKMWQIHAMSSALWYSSTAPNAENRDLFMSAIKMPIIGGGFTFGVAAYAALTALGWPVMLIYGFIRGMGALPHTLVLEFFGALLGRYYFAKRFGLTQWRQYAPVLLAGFSCGMGLMSMVAIAFALIKQSLTQLPF
jgi:hypothetical protein